MNKKANAVIILIFIFILITGFSIFISNSKKSDAEIISQDTPEVEKEGKSSTTQESNELNESSSSVSMDDENIEEDLPDSLTCVTTQISYSMENLNQTSKCNNYSGEICINQTVDCFVEIHNRDPKISGLFQIELSFLQKGENRKDKFGSQIQNFTLSPMHFDIFEGSTTIQSTGEDGLANKEINCFYNTLKIPTKEICG